MKERRCRKCKLTYKGLKERCPFCHKLTKLGLFNRFMCIIGYMAFALLIVAFIYFALIHTVATAIWVLPTIATVLIIAVIVAIAIFVCK